MYATTPNCQQHWVHRCGAWNRGYLGSDSEPILRHPLLSLRLSHRPQPDLATRDAATPSRRLVVKRRARSRRHASARGDADRRGGRAARCGDAAMHAAEDCTHMSGRTQACTEIPTTHSAEEPSRPVPHRAADSNPLPAQGSTPEAAFGTHPLEYTGGSLRHPSFRGLRNDKIADEGDLPGRH
ncbi:hypothetical protein BS297_07355 [Rhodococcus erythropolis]|uniref:Uncharacterized protein n=1 Tax=Rhodococcus erythropolis TaxID=1833 RepID=A0A5N5E6F3_RHOER|nr:hypothetical protein BS297_07355 [Rhodococcus erythropolis]